jgi:glycosyltransferase involved in cell wall biosynthesis
MSTASIAVIIPCYNEEQTIATVVSDFQKELPDANIYVYDNNSTDNSINIASSCGVIVKQEFSQGKGNVVRTMFREIDADIYVMVDADNTYPASSVNTMIKTLIDKKADVVVGDRLSKGDYAKQNKRNFHNFGNSLVRWLINKLFKSNLTDIMSGYRVFNKKFVKNIPVMSPNFEIETEMTIHALDKRFRIVEVPVNYIDRPQGSVSKLNTFTDGFKVLRTILMLFKNYRPLLFFTIISILFFISSITFFIPILLEFLNTGLVSKIPTAVLSLGLMIVSIISLFVGFILDTVVRQYKTDYELNLK